MVYLGWQLQLEHVVTLKRWAVLWEIEFLLILLCNLPHS